MNTPESVDVLVVGAGPIGLVLASELRRHGVEARIVEKLAERPHLSKGLTVHSRSLETFDIMGLADKLIERGFPSRGLNLSSDAGSPAFVSMEHLPGRYPYILILPQWQTEEIVEEHLNERGVELERERELVSLIQGESHVESRVRAADGTIEVIRSRYVVGCDGAHSAVRKAAEIGFPGKPYPWAAQVMDISVKTEEPIHVLENYTTRRGFVMFMPFADGTHRVITMDHAKSSDGRPPTVAENQELIDTVVTAKTIELVGEPVWSSQLGILQHRQASTYRRGRVFLAGDAAHINFPTGGQGMNCGINDSLNLAWKLALVLRHGASDTLLDSYEEERYPVAAQVGKLTHRMSKLYTVRNPVGLFIRKQFLRAIGHKQKLQRKMAIGLSGHAVNYGATERAKRLRQSLTPEAVQVGAPAPDAQVRTADGVEARLYELLRTPYFHLLLFNRDPAATTALGAKVEDKYGELVNVHRIAGDQGELARAYGAKAPAAILIRPDGYVGFHVASDEWAAIDSALGEWLPAASTKGRVAA